MNLGLCNFCRGITIDELAVGYEYGPTSAQLEKLRDECSLCRLIHAALSEVSGRHDSDKIVLQWNSNRDVLLSSHSTTSSLERPINDGRKLLSSEKPAISERIICSLDSNGSHDGPPEITNSRQGELRVFASEGSTAAVLKLLSGRPVVSPNSDLALGQCRTWLTACLSDHERCRTGLSGAFIDDHEDPPPLPTRVIDVSSMPRVVVSAGQKSQFLALSYCWGSAIRSDSSPPAFLLTKGTFDTFTKALPVDKLPKTIQDAILVTQKLGYRYIWVDCLCIIQDSPEDWFRESQNMGQIFQNATCALAATAAENSSEGLFNRGYVDLELQDSGQMCENFVKVPCVYRGEKLGDMCVARMTGKPPPWSPLRTFNEELDRSSWNHRAWVVQERLLSRRILHFGQTQSFFECQNGLCSESLSPRATANEVMDLQSKRSILDRLGRESTLANTMTASSQELRTMRAFTYSASDFVLDKLGFTPWESASDPQWRFWSRVIKYYNITRITYEKDKLVAVLGLAKMLEKRLCLTYCAGLWIEEIARGLFWWADLADGGHLFRLKDAKAPTWSWAGWQGSPRFATFVSEFDNARPRVVEHHDRTQDPSTPRSMLRVAAYCWQAKITRTGVDTFRHNNWQAKRSLTPEAFVEPLAPFEPDERLDFVLHVNTGEHESDHSLGLMQCDDVFVDPKEEQTCLCMVLHSTPVFKETSEAGYGSEHRAYGYHLLVLQPSGTVSDAYERIGVGVCVSLKDDLPQGWFRHLAPTKEYILV